MPDIEHIFGPNYVIKTDIEFTPKNKGEDLFSVVLSFDDREPLSADFLKTVGNSLTLDIGGKEITHNQADQIGDNPLSFPFDVRLGREIARPVSVTLKVKGQSIGAWKIHADNSLETERKPVISALTLRQLDQDVPPAETQKLSTARSTNPYAEFAGALTNAQMMELVPEAKGTILPLDRTVSDVEIAQAITAREQALGKPETFKNALREIVNQAKRDGLESIHLTTALIWEPEILAAVHEVAPQLGVQVSFSPAIDKSPENVGRKQDYIATRLPELLKSPYVTGLSFNGPDVYHASGLELYIHTYNQITATAEKPVILSINAGERNYHVSNIDAITKIISDNLGAKAPILQIVGGLFGADPQKMIKLQEALAAKGGSLQFVIDPAYYLTTGENPGDIDAAISKLSSAGIKIAYCSKAPGMTGYAFGEYSEISNASQLGARGVPPLVANTNFDPTKLSFEDKSAEYARQEKARLDEISAKLDFYMRDEAGAAIPRGFPEKADGALKKPILIMAGSIANGINPEPKTTEEKATVQKMRADIRVMLETLDPTECAIYTGCTASGFEALVQQEAAAWNKVHPDRKFDICGLVVSAALTDENKPYLTNSFTHMQYVGKNWDEQLSALTAISSNPADITLVTVGGGSIVRQAIDVAKSQGITTLLWSGPSPDQAAYAKLWQEVYEAAIVAPLLDALRLESKAGVSPEMKGPGGGYVTPYLSKYQQYLSQFMKQNPDLSKELDLALAVEKLEAAIKASMNDDRNKTAKTIKAISDHQHGHLRAQGGASAKKIEQYAELQDFAFGDGLQLSTLLQQNAPAVVRHDLERDSIRTQYLSEWREAPVLPDASAWKNNSEIKSDFTDEIATTSIVRNKLLPALMAEDKRLFDDAHRADRGKKPTYSPRHYFNSANYEKAWPDDVRANPARGAMGLELVYNTREQAEHANVFIKSILHSKGFQIDSPHEINGKFVLNTNMQPSEYNYLIQMGEALFVAESKEQALGCRELLEKQTAHRYPNDLPESTQFMPSAGSFQLLRRRSNILDYMKSLAPANPAEDRSPVWVESGLRLQPLTDDGVYGYTLQKSQEITAHGTHSPFNLSAATDANGVTFRAAAATMQRWRGKEAYADTPSVSQVIGKIIDATLPLEWFQKAANALAKVVGREKMPVIGVAKTATSATIAAGAGEVAEHVMQPALTALWAGGRVRQAVADGTARGIDYAIERLKKLASQAGLGLGIDPQPARPVSQLSSMRNVLSGNSKA